MAIEAIDENVQTQLVSESREEKLTKLFNMENEIQKLRVQKDRANSEVNSLKNQIKKMESNKLDLLQILNSGQGTFIPVAAQDDTEPGDDEDDDNEVPSDEELAGFMDAEPGAEGGEGESTEVEGEQPLTNDAASETGEDPVTTEETTTSDEESSTSSTEAPGDEAAA